MERIKKWITPANAAVLAAAVILLTVLCIPIGVANNGDFDRVLSSAGLEYLSDADKRYFDYVDEYYRIGFKAEPSAQAEASQPSAVQAETADAGSWTSGLQNLYLTTHMIPVWATVLASSLFTGIYNIRILGLVYGAIFLLALWLGIGGITKRYGKAAGWISAALGIFIFCDVGYLSYFNSFYGEAASYVFLLLAAGAFVALIAQEKPKLWHMVVYFVGAAMFVGSKQQNVLLVVFFLGISVRLFFLCREKRWRWTCGIMSAVMVLASASTMISVSDEIYEINIHQAVFIGILELSDDPASDLEELGISEQLAVMAGHTYYETDVPYPPDSEFMQTEFFDKISYGKIIRFYLAHPDMLWAAMERTAEDGYEVMQPYLGSYTESAGDEPGAKAKGFAVYDNFRHWALGSNTFPLIVTILLYLLAIGLMLRSYVKRRDRRHRAMLELMALILLIGVIQFAMPYIADGRGDLNKHLFLFNMATDMLIFAAGVGAGKFLACRLRKRYQ